MNPRSVSELFVKINREELTELLYSLFYAHGKIIDLLNCAIEHELAAIGNYFQDFANHLDCAADFVLPDTSILLNILMTLMHNDLGQKFISVPLIPLLNSVVGYYEAHSQVTSSKN